MAAGKPRRASFEHLFPPVASYLKSYGIASTSAKMPMAFASQVEPTNFAVTGADLCRRIR